MSGIELTTENYNIALNLASIIDEIKASQQKVLKAFEEHNIFVNKSLEKLQQIKTETKVEVVKVKDPLEELKKVKEEFDKVYIQENELEHIRKELQYPLLKVSEYENNPKSILRLGWIESITFKECKNIKSISLHFQNCRYENKFKYYLDESSNEYTIYFGSIDDIHIVNNCIHTSMFPIYLLPYQEVYFTCEKIDETKPCNADMLYKYYISNMNIHFKPVIFTIQNKNFVIKDGCIQNEFDVSKTQWEYLRKIVDILSLYDNSKISTSFKDTFLYIFKKCVQDKIKESFHILKQNILKVRDIRWLLLEMEKYPQLFHFTEEDLLLMKENNASRDNIYLVKKFLKKDGDYEDYYPEEKGGGIKCKYHMTGGSLNGEYKEWHQNAQLYIQQYYKDSKLEGECKMWYPNRKIDIQHYYKDEKNEGECKWQPQNGQLYFQGYYKEDKQEGESKWWYENGQIDSQGYYKEGKRDGEWKHWNEDGTLKEKRIYKDGKKQV